MATPPYVTMAKSKVLAATAAGAGSHDDPLADPLLFLSDGYNHERVFCIQKKA